MGSYCRGGVHLLSAYLFCNEGLSQRNLDLLQGIALVIRQLRGPWIMAADFNVPPQVLESSGWPRMVSGVVQAPGCATCNASEYD